MTFVQSRKIGLMVNSLGAVINSTVIDEHPIADWFSAAPDLPLASPFPGSKVRIAFPLWNAGMALAHTEIILGASAQATRRTNGLIRFVLMGRAEDRLNSVSEIE